MTVLDTCDCGDVDVAWFDGDKLNETTFPDEALEQA